MQKTVQEDLCSTPRLPDAKATAADYLGPTNCVLSDDELDQVATATDGYSGSDLTSLCKEAAMRPVRELSSDQLAVVDVQSLRALTSTDVLASMSVVRPSVQASVLKSFESWNAEFGSDMNSV